MSPESVTRPVTDSVAKVNGEVAIGEDLHFQRSWWRFERLAWMFFTFIIALDVAGLFGRGPIAQARRQAPDQSLEVQYERIARTGTPSIMRVSLGSSVLHDGQADLFVSDALVGPLGAQRIIPQPSRTRIGSGGLTYTFPVGLAPALVRFELQPAAAGIYAFTLAIPGATPVSAKILVVP